jgi:pyrroloquinoline quinone biosynthesis protein D
VNSPDLNLRPRLAPHVRLQIEPVRGEPVLLFPEGLLILNETAHAIVRRCDGQARIADMVRDLAEEFEVDEAVLRADVLENLDELRQRNLLLLSP